jgi:transcription antitermination factor NusG
LNSLNRATETQWFALRVKARQEWRVNELLRHKGYELFLPTRAQTRGGIQDHCRPLFPGYLFCRLDPRIRLPILTTPGVMGFVGAGKVPLPVEDEELDNVRVIVASRLSRENVPMLSKGDRVLVVEGPLRGIEGVLVRERNQWRVVVAITLLQRSVAVDINSGWLKPAGQQTSAGACARSIWSAS